MRSLGQARADDDASFSALINELAREPARTSSAMPAAPRSVVPATTRPAPAWVAPAVVVGAIAVSGAILYVALKR